MRVRYRYSSLEDFLTSQPLTVDGVLDDGWGAHFPVKGRELRAVVLFCDIAAFSRRTRTMNPTETLIFVNNFFAWITAEALRDRPGIVDKYLGDEMMVVFSSEFGSADPFLDAVQTARWMCENDAWDFCPHIGISAGPVLVGYVGTPLRYNCSVFGAPVALAARCAAVRPRTADSLIYSSCVVFPASDWEGYELSQALPPKHYTGPDGEPIEAPMSWELLPPVTVPMKNLPDTSIRALVNCALHCPQQLPEDRAREGLRALAAAGRYWPPRR